MSVETRVRAPINYGFKPMEGFSDQRRFPPAMQMNEEAIKHVFALAGLDYGGIAIEPMSQSEVVSNSGRKKKLFVTEKVNNRWRIQVVDGEMKSRSEKKNSRDDHWKSFIQELNGIIKEAVLDCMVKEERLEAQSGKFSTVVLKAFEIYDSLNCRRFLYLGNGRTLVRESK